MYISHIVVLISQLVLNIVVKVIHQLLSPNSYHRMYYKPVELITYFFLMGLSIFPWCQSHVILTYNFPHELYLKMMDKLNSFIINVLGWTEKRLNMNHIKYELTLFMYTNTYIVIDYIVCMA